MDLKEFITQTLCQIQEGVHGAQLERKGRLGTINPHPDGFQPELAKRGFFWSDNGGNGQIVEFDVALTVTEGTGTKGGIGVFAGAVNLGSSGQSKNESTSVSRVRFAVPLLLPDHTHGEAPRTTK